MLGLVVFIAAFSYLALVRPLALLASLAALWIVTVALSRSVTVSVVASGVQIYPVDLLALIMAAIGTTRLLKSGLTTLGSRLTLLLMTLFVLYVSRGIVEVGVQTAINSARGPFYFLAAIAYAASVPGGWDARIWKVFSITGLLLASLAVPFWLTGGLGSAGEMGMHNGELVTSRPIVAAGALVILQAAILFLALRWPSKRLASLAAMWCVVVLVLLQHRTLWVAGLLVAAVGIVWWLLTLDRRHERAAVATIGIMIPLLPIAAGAFLATGPLVRSTGTAVGTNSTLNWRVTGWEELLKAHHSVAQLTVGEPSGASINRSIDQQTVDVSAHNEFVESYLRFGILGFLTLIWIGLLLRFKRGRVASGIGLTRQAVGLLLLAQFISCITYSLDAIQGIITGALLSGLVANDAVHPIRAQWRRPAVVERAQR